MACGGDHASGPFMSTERFRFRHCSPAADWSMRCRRRRRSYSEMTRDVIPPPAGEEAAEIRENKRVAAIFANFKIIGICSITGEEDCAGVEFPLGKDVRRSVTAKHREMRFSLNGFAAEIGKIT